MNQTLIGRRDNTHQQACGTQRREQAGQRLRGDDRVSKQRTGSAHGRQRNVRTACEGNEAPESGDCAVTTPEP